MAEARVEVVDLRSEPAGHAALAALAALRELSPGASLQLLTAEEPGLLMASLNLQLRDALIWQSAAEAGGWRTRVRLASDAEPDDVIALLVRDHRRLDELLGRALRRLNAADLPSARALLAQFADGLRRHAAAEEALVAPALAPAPVEAMLSEHGELGEQLVALEEALGESGESWQIEPLAALLSGTLAKHEHREESALFPVWRAKLAALDAPAGAALLERVRRATVA